MMTEEDLKKSNSDVDADGSNHTDMNAPFNSNANSDANSDSDNDSTHSDTRTEGSQKVDGANNQHLDQKRSRENSFSEVKPESSHSGNDDTHLDTGADNVENVVVANNEHLDQKRSRENSFSEVRYLNQDMSTTENQNNSKLSDTHDFEYFNLEENNQSKNTESDGTHENIKLEGRRISEVDFSFLIDFLAHQNTRIAMAIGLCVSTVFMTAALVGIASTPIIPVLGVVGFFASGLIAGQYCDYKKNVTDADEIENLFEELPNFPY